MRKQRTSTLMLVAFLALFYSIDYFGKLLGWSFHLSTTFYCVFALPAIFYILTPRLRRFPFVAVVLFWVAIYVVLRWFLKELPLMGEQAAFQTFSEGALIAISALLGREVSTSYNDIQRVLERITAPVDGQRVMEKDESIGEIKKEFVRSRRHNRPLSLLVLEPSSGSLNVDLQQIINDIQHEMSERFLAASLAHAIIEEVRRNDLIIKRNDHGRFAVLCPETNPEGSAKLAKRICESVMEKLGIPLAYGTASFPDEAITFEDLVSHAEFQLTHYLKLPTVQPAESNRENDPGHR
jgi:GGDEF domain-containing protein